MYELCKNENSINISLHQIYLPKLHENILKYYGLNWVKDIAIGFNHSLHTTSESSASLSNSLFVGICKCCHYPCLQFIFNVAWSFVSLSLNHAWLIIKGIAIWGVRWSDVWGGKVTETFLQPRLHGLFNKFTDFYW